MTEESIHDIIQKSAHLGEEGALRSLMARPKIKGWINGDPDREKRLRDEFHRLWQEHHGDFTKPHEGPRAGPAAPPLRPAPQVKPAAQPPAQQVHREEPRAPTPEPRPTPIGRVRDSMPHRQAPEPEMEPDHDEAPRGRGMQKPVKGGRRESFMCITCGALAIYSDWEGEGIKVRCHACKTEYPDLLKLIPVKEVGPIELLFGPGPMGYAKAAGTVLAPFLLYLIFRLTR